MKIRAVLDRAAIATLTIGPDGSIKVAGHRVYAESAPVFTDLDVETIAVEGIVPELQKMIVGFTAHDNLYLESRYPRKPGKYRYLDAQMSVVIMPPHKGQGSTAHYFMELSSKKHESLLMLLELFSAGKIAPVPGADFEQKQVAETPPELLEPIPAPVPAVVPVTETVALAPVSIRAAFVALLNAIANHWVGGAKSMNAFATK